MPAGHGVLTLEVRAGNAQARGFYTRLGFQEAAVRTAYYEDPPDDAVIMALPLGVSAERAFIGRPLR